MSLVVRLARAKTLLAQRCASFALKVIPWQISLIGFPGSLHSEQLKNARSRKG